MEIVTKPMALDETLQATNEILEDIKDSLANSSIVGDTDISEIADGTLTGAVAEFDGDISDINTTLEGLGDAATKDVANTYDAESTDPISGQGVAEALETQEVESLSDTTPYLYRKSPAIGTRVMENALVGASVVVNQLIETANKSFTNGNLTDTRDEMNIRVQDNSNNVLKNIAPVQKGLLSVIVTSANAFTGLNIKHSGAARDFTLYSNSQFVGLANHKYLFSILVKDNRPNVENGISTDDLMFIDLTQWFGSSTIPDAAYTKEQSTAGSGIAWLKEQGFDFSKYIAYNTGELCSVNPSAKKVVGKNLFNKALAVNTRTTVSGEDIILTTTGNYQGSAGVEIKAITDTFLCVSGTIPTGCAIECYFTDDNGNTTASTVVVSASGSVISIGDVGTTKVTMFLGNRTSGAGTFVFKNIQVEFVASTTSQPTSYAPYEEHTYPISPSPLRGLFTLVNDTIKASGDVRSADGSVEKVRGSVDLGTLSWSYDSTYTRMLATLNGCEVATARTIQYVCEKYVSCNDGRSVVDIPDKSVYNGYEGSISLVFIKDTSYTDAATFKTAMNGVYLEYPLATPTTESLAPFDNPQISIVGGTEEFVTDNDVPVGHESEYKKLPPLFEDDYIQTIAERAENVIGEIEDITPISGTATVTLLHEEDQGEDWIVGFTGEINGHFDTDKFDYYLTARYTHAYNTNTQILNMNNCTDGDYVNIWQTGTAFDFGVDGGVTVDISVTSTKLTFSVNCIGDSIFGIYSSSEPTGTVKYLITPARKG